MGLGLRGTKMQSDTWRLRAVYRGSKKGALSMVTQS